MQKNKKNSLIDSGTVKRKQDHIQLCLTGDVNYNYLTNGFEKYIFIHDAVTEVEINNIDFTTKFFSKKIDYPFLISCMTGGTKEAEKINEMLADAARQLNIPVGVGSQRQALENKILHNSYRVIRKNSGNVPVLGNIGAAQVAHSTDIVNEIKMLIDLVEADAMVIHFNSLHELLQNEGEPNFNGVLKNIEKLTSRIDIPFIVKEVGSGINKKAAKKLLDAGIKGIDVAGAGGTSWAAVELLRNNSNKNYEFRDWGLPTAYCLKSVHELKSKYKFMLISSGGVNNGIDIAKSLALGANLTASARIILQKVMEDNSEGVITLIKDWFDTVKNVMFLTGSATIKELQKNKLIRISEIY